MELFLEKFAMYGIKFIFLAAVAVGGVFAGKALRTMKDAKKNS